jgi:hypothetical protein
VRSLLRVCVPRRRDSIITFGELDKLEAMTTVRRTKMFVRRRTRAVVFVRRSTTRLDPPSASLLMQSYASALCQTTEKCKEPIASHSITSSARRRDRALWLCLGPWQPECFRPSRQSKLSYRFEVPPRRKQLASDPRVAECLCLGQKATCARGKATSASPESRHGSISGSYTGGGHR